MRWTLALSLLAACGGDSKPATPDADVGFNKPSKSLKANMEMSNPDEWVELGPANLSCLNTPSDDAAATVDITLNTTVKDFQSSNDVPGVSVSVFPDIDLTNTLGTGTSDQTGALSIAIPMGHKRIGFKMTKTDDGTSTSPMDTFLLNQYLDPSMPTQTKPDKIQTVSRATALTLPALIGETRTNGTGVAAGALRDCDGHEMSNFVVTISSTSGTSTPMDGAEAFYFAAIEPSDLPVHHVQADAANKDGLFMLIQVPPAASAFVQAWGYPTDADVASGNLQLISELQVPVLADTVITGSFEPLRK